MLIGLFLLGGITIFVGFIFFLHPSVGDEKQILYVRFSDINKINVGTRVLFAGKAVGEVTDITEIYHARETQPFDSLGRLYFYQLTLKIDSSVKVFDTDEIEIQTSGLLGEKSISIVPRSPKKGVIPERVTAKTPFYAESIDPIENTFNQLSDISQKVEDTVDLIEAWIKNNSDNLSRAVSGFANAMEQINITMTQVNEEKIVPQVKIGIQSFTDVMNKVDSSLTQMINDKVFVNIGTIVSNLTTTSANVNQIMATVASGKGTLGKLLESEDFYLRINAILSKVDTLMNDVNHYGVLFHLNKTWQKNRTKRLTQLNALQTPEDFRTYFETEIDDINTAMARISMLIEKAKQEPEQELVIQSPAFRQDFAELMRQVEEMANNLKLYNEQLMELSTPELLKKEGT